MNANEDVLNSSYESDATNIKLSDIFGQDSDNNADHVNNNKDDYLGNFDADKVDSNEDIFDKASVGFNEDDADANQDIFEYQRKNDRTALPKRAVNNKKTVAQRRRLLWPDISMIWIK